MALGFNTLTFNLAEDHSHLTISNMTFDSRILRAAEKIAEGSALDFRVTIEPGDIYDVVIGERKTVFVNSIADRMTKSIAGLARPISQKIIDMLDINRGIYAPLIVDNEVRGVQVVISPDLSETDIPAVTTFTNQIAIAIENVQSRDALRLAHERLSYLISSSPAVIYTSKAHGDYGATFISENVVEMTGYQPHEFTDDAGFWAAHIHPEDAEQVFDELSQLFEHNHHLHEYRFLHRDGSYRWMHDELILVRDEQGEPLETIGYWIDITEFKDLQERLIRSEKLAVLGQLAGGVGHELRNPLGVIKNAVYYLNMALENPDAKIKEMLDLLQREVIKSEHIISSLLDYARTHPPTRSEVALNEVIQQTLSLIEVPEDIQVKIQLDEMLPLILADPGQLDQIFGNIIINSIQAMPEGGHLSIETRQENDEWLAVSIADTGTGILPENIAKIFEPLFTTKSKGIGLGLAITKTLIEGHGGTIEAESEGELGKGSVFTIRLPLLSN
jgi:PAS domain S-box-containing protein